MIKPDFDQQQNQPLTYEQRIQSDSGFAMSELGRFFENDSKVHHSLIKITRKLEELEIPYTIVGGLALASYGYYRATDDIDILTSRENLKKIHKQLVGLGYKQAFSGSKNLLDAETQVKIEFLITGDFPGDGKDKPVAFPDPEDVAIKKDGVNYLGLEKLIELKLASGMTAAHRAKDHVDVQELIRILKLDDSFAEQLNPYVRDAFIKCWANARRRYVLLWRNKFLTTEAESIEDMARILREASDQLSAMLADGVVLDPDGGTGDDYAMLVTEDPAIAEKYGMHEEEEWWWPGEDEEGPRTQP